MLGRDRTDVRLLLLTAAALMAMGLAVLYSAGQTDVPTAAGRLWERQLTFLGIGIVGALIVSRISTRLLEWATPAFYVFALTLLALTLVVGTGAGTASSSKSWLPPRRYSIDTAASSTRSNATVSKSPARCTWSSRASSL